MSHHCWHGGSAVAALALVQAGRLDLDTDVNSYLKSWKVPSNAFTDVTKVTLRHLLSHTAGVTVHGFAGYRAGDPFPSLVEVLNGAPPANNNPITVDIELGRQFRYSGGGYVIAQQLLIDVTGESFADFLDETVLRPIGTTRSSFRPPLPSTATVPAATPYLSSGEPVPGGAHVSPELAAAGLWTTPTDLARFAVAMQDALAGRATRMLSQSTVKEMLTPRLGDYGLGFDIDGTPPRRHFGHAGVDEGFESVMIAYEGGDGAVVMTNAEGGMKLANEVIRSISAEYRWPDFHPVTRKRVAIDPRLFKRYVGNYEVSPDLRIEISRVGEHLFAQATGQDRVELFPESDHVFFPTAIDAKIRFEAKGGAHPVRLVLHLDDEDLVATRTR